MANIRKSKLPIVVLVCVLFLTPLALINIPVGASTTITTFSTGAQDISITFAVAGKDNSAHLTIPKGCTVNTASISLEGKPLRSATPSTVEFTFNDTTNNQVWSGSATENISKTTKDPSQWQSAVQGGGALANDDSVYLQSVGKGATYVYQQFSFKVDMVEITDMTIEWNGYAYTNGGVVNTDNIGAQMFIWNNQTLAWEELGYYDGGHGLKLFDYWIKKTMSGSLDNYLYNKDEVRVVGSNWYTGSAISATNMYSDFIKAKVTGKSTSYPKDVSLDIGDDGTVDFTHTGFLMGMDTFSGDTFKSVLQSKLDAAGPGHGSLDIALSVSSNNPGIVRIGNVSITVDEYLNKAPIPLEIPSTFHFPEDTTTTNLINLTKYFTDDMDKSTELTYTFGNESTPKYIHATVSTHGLMTFTTPTKDWFGNATFTVSAKDTGSLATVSQPFTVKVDPMPDAPVLKHIGSLNFTRDKPAMFQVQATDPDNLWGGVDSLSYSVFFLTGSPFFTLNSKTGAAIFTPTEDNVGNYSVNFTATDSHGLTGSEIVAVQVINVNYPPVWVAIGKQTIDEGKPYDLQLKATDVDKADKDNLEYSVAFLDGGAMFTMGADGHVSFTPAKTMVGTHHVRFTVTDTVGHKINLDVTFEIRNVNSPPAIKPIPDQKVNRNAPLHLKIDATDDDIGIVTETLAFSDDSSIFKIDENTGWINITPTTSQVGKYVIKVTVTDLHSATATKSFNLEVVLNNTVPDAKIVVTGNKTKVKEGSTVTLTAQATDKDNDPMTYKWTENGKDLGTDKELTMKSLKAGKHTITLEVSDPFGKTTVTQVIEVQKKNTGIPGFDAGLVIMAMTIVCLVSFVLARRRQ
jgi:hypothetical protein